MSSIGVVLSRVVEFNSVLVKQIVAAIFELALIAAVVALVSRHPDPYYNYFRAHPVLMATSYVMMCQVPTLPILLRHSVVQK